MKVVILSLFDWAFAGSHIAAALKYNGVDAVCYTLRSDSNPFQYPLNHPVSTDEWQYAAEQADYVIWKGDEPVPDDVLALVDNHKLVHLVEGTRFRVECVKSPPCALGTWPDSVYLGEVERGIRLACVSPDLALGRNLPLTWMKHPYPVEACEFVPIEDRAGVIHIPSNPSKKGTAEIERSTQVKVITGVHWAESLAAKSTALWYVDQIAIGWYGYALIEAAAFGIPCMCYFDPRLVDTTPILHIESALDIDLICSTDLFQGKKYAVLAKATRDWCLEEHGYGPAGKRWIEYLAS